MEYEKNRKCFLCLIYKKNKYLDSICSSATCSNGGTCRQIAATMVECLCATGFAGPTCALRK